MCLFKVFQVVYDLYLLYHSHTVTVTTMETETGLRIPRAMFSPGTHLISKPCRPFTNDLTQEGTAFHVCSWAVEIPEMVQLGVNL